MKKHIISKILITLLLVFTVVFEISCKPTTENPGPNDGNNPGGEIIYPPKPPKNEIQIGIKSSSEVKSGKSITLKANVTGAISDDTVTWAIKSGAEYATISEKGKLTAKNVEGDKVIEVTATSNEDNEAVATKIITIVAKPTLTQDMLDTLNNDKMSFEGYVNISLYTFGLFEKLYSTYVTVVKTAMDGTNWYSEYENGDTYTKTSIYYKNHGGIASQVGVSFMNDEEYYPMKNSEDQDETWEEAGLYNSLKNLKVSDFKFNEETWRYEYKGSNKKLIKRVLASANPYDFEPTNLALIIEEGEIMGIYSKSKEDYTILSNYKAIQELYVAINCGDDVDVPTISKYSHEDIHDDLAVAINNMNNLNSYELDFKNISYSYLSSGYTQDGYTEKVTEDICHFVPYSVTYNNYGDEIHTPQENASYGYKKISDNLYNTYNKIEDKFVASRAYQKDFKKAKPSFGFAAEIFRSVYKDEEKGTVTYYVDDLMSPVASTFYYGVGNDINLYGIFATRGYTSENNSFTPYVVVKDNYIIEAGFYYYVGYLYGVIELKYNNFNETTIDNIEEITFDVREVPTSWSQLTIEVSEDESSTDEDVTTNALEYLKTFYGNENIGEELPFFGNALGDTYGFGLTTIQIPGGSTTAKKAIVFYYDVPLDINYTITSSLEAVEKYLLDLGFEKNKYGEFNKGDICVLPKDSSLDLVIYVWKA